MNQNEAQGIKHFFLLRNKRRRKKEEGKDGNTDTASPRPDPQPKKRGRKQKKTHGKNKSKRQERQNGSSPHINYTDQWMSALEQGIQNFPYLTQLTELLASLPPLQQQRYPIIPPPTNNHSKGGTRTPNSSFVRPSSSRQPTNSFVHLEIDSDSEEDKQEEAAVVELPIYSEKTIQVRYILKFAQCHLVEAYREVAVQEGHANRWSSCVSNWQLAFDIAYEISLELKSWEVASSNNNDGHDLQRLKELKKIWEVLKDDTEGKRALAIKEMKNKLKRLTDKLENMQRNRDGVRRSIGNIRWKNNPNPKMTFAERILALTLETHVLEKAIQDISELQLSQDIERSND